MQINLSTYRIFRDLVNTQSFSKAASLHSITQSAVSQQVSGLEKKMDCSLIERGKKELCLTPEGRKFFKVCHDIIDIQERFLKDIRELNHQITGGLNISTVYSIGLHDLPPYLKKFIKQFPGVNVHVEYRRSNQVYEDLQKDVSDLGFVAFPEKKPKFTIKPFKRDRLVLICHPSHRLANFKAASIKQLVGQKFIGFDPDLPTRKALQAILKKHHIEVEEVMQFDNIETLKRAVEIDMGVSLVPLSTVTQELRNRTLKAIEFADEEFFRPLAIVHKSGKKFSAPLLAFLQLLEGEPESEFTS
jgi:LysR family transcriptional regulator, transcriptional activator of the cysJI operon